MAAMSPAAIESLAGEILRAASLGPHAVFSLRADAGRDAFKAKYRELARALHPDKARSRAAEEAFKVVTESFRAVAAGNDALGGGCAGARTDDRASDSTSKAPFWRVRGEDAAAAPPRWSAGAGARETEKTPAAPRWSAAARGSADAAPPARAFEKSSRGGWRPSDANLHGGRREAKLASPETVRPDETLVDEGADDDAGSFDPSQPEPPAWFNLDRREDATGSTKTKTHENATARWNDSATHSRSMLFRSAKSSSRARTGLEAEEDPFPYDETLEDDPERDVEDDTSFGGEKVWGLESETRRDGGTGGGWGDASFQKRAAKNSRDAWRGGWSDATEAFARRAPPAASRAAAGDFRGFDGVMDVGDPSELERLAFEGNEENERFGVVDGNEENDTARANDEAPTKNAPKKNARDEDAPSGAAGRDAGGGAEAGEKKKKPAGSRKRGRSKKAAGAVPAAPRPRLAALDEPRIPHTKLPRKKFAQATLAFS